MVRKIHHNAHMSGHRREGPPMLIPLFIIGGGAMLILIKLNIVPWKIDFPLFEYISGAGAIIGGLYMIYRKFVRHVVIV
ncbi:MAG: hypothetical protein KKF44_11225 [Nanoarchaeota archaeon]|nr:hypothetical protein [Nanoarchaeota archaeon]